MDRIDFKILAVPSEAAQLAAACSRYAEGWRWGFSQRALGLADTDWQAFRSLRATGYDDVTYRGVRHGFQANWCAEHRGVVANPPDTLAHCAGSTVRRSGAELLAMGAIFATEPPLPPMAKISSLRVQQDGDGWAGSVSIARGPAAGRAPVVRKCQRKGPNAAAGARPAVGAVGG